MNRETNERPFCSKKTAYGLCMAAVACYLLSACAFSSKPITIVDELEYIRQAVSFAHGQTTLMLTNPETGKAEESAPSKYPCGTSAMMTPLVYAFGWRGAYALPLLALPVAVLLVGVWLSREGRSPLWAILILSYPPVLVIGLHAMSDLPSLAAVALVMLLFWRGISGHWSNWLVAGFVASASCLIRETNALIYASLFLGALIRRDKNVWALILGGLVGVAFWAAAQYAAYGLFLQRSYVWQYFSLGNAVGNLPLYLVATLVFIPGGLLAGLLYRGSRRWEIRLTIVTTLLFFLAWYSGIEGGLSKKLLLDAPRFAIGLLPLLIFSLSEEVPQWLNRASAITGNRGRRWLARLARMAVVLWLIGTFVAVVSTPPLLTHWSQSRSEITSAIYENTSDGDLLITNFVETTKYIHELNGPRVPLDLLVRNANVLLDRINASQRVSVVLVARSDSKVTRRTTQRCMERIEWLQARYVLTPVLDRQVTTTDRVRIWKLSRRPATSS